MKIGMARWAGSAVRRLEQRLEALKARFEVGQILDDRLFAASSELAKARLEPYSDGPRRLAALTAHRDLARRMVADEEKYLAEGRSGYFSTGAPELPELGAFAEEAGRLLAEEVACWK